MPDTMDDKQLAEEFAEFFMGKINKICKALDSNPTYEPIDITMHCKIWKFRRLATREVENIIMKIQMKSCESDMIRAELLKAELTKTLPIIVKIMNTSLEEGMFANDWKTAIVRPCAKENWTGTDTLKLQASF